MDVKERVRRELLERFIATGKVGLIRPQSESEAVDLIETVVALYDEEKEEAPVTMSLSEMSAKLKEMLDF